MPPTFGSSEGADLRLMGLRQVRAHISPTLGEHRGQLVASTSSAVTSVLAGFRQLPHSSGETAFDYGSIGRGPTPSVSGDDICENRSDDRYNVTR